MISSVTWLTEWIHDVYDNANICIHVSTFPAGYQPLLFFHHPHTSVFKRESQEKGRIVPNIYFLRYNLGQTSCTLKSCTFLRALHISSVAKYVLFPRNFLWRILQCYLSVGMLLITEIWQLSHCTSETCFYCISSDLTEEFNTWNSKLSVLIPFPWFNCLLSRETLFNKDLNFFFDSCILKFSSSSCHFSTFLWFHKMFFFIIIIDGSSDYKPFLNKYLIK